MSFKIIGTYVKKLNFNIPNSKIFSELSQQISNYKINIDIKSNQLRNRILEIETALNLKPLNLEGEVIQTNIIYSTIIELTENTTDKKKIEKIILIEVPLKIYPELRKIFLFVFENSGFKDVKISEKVDFQQLYESRKIQ